MQKPIELRIRHDIPHSGGNIPFVALFLEEQSEIPPGWQLEPITFYLNDGRPAVAYCKLFPWHTRIVGEIGNQCIVL